MEGFSEAVLAGAAREREVALTTFGRTTATAYRTTLWISSDGRRLFVRSGGGLGRHWPQNLLARGTGVLHLANGEVRVRGRLITDPAEARTVSGLVVQKYGPGVQRSLEGEPLTPGEQASFELLPAGPD